MNNKRRAKIKDVINKLNGIMLFYNKDIINNDDFAKDMGICYMEIEFILSDEISSYDNIPESLQCGKIGMQIEEYIDDLDECLELIDEIVEWYDQENKRYNIEKNYNCLIKILSDISKIKRR